MCLTFVKTFVIPQGTERLGTTALVRSCSSWDTHGALVLLKEHVALWTR